MTQSLFVYPKMWVGTAIGQLRVEPASNFARGPTLFSLSSPSFFTEKIKNKLHWLHCPWRSFRTWLTCVLFYLSFAPGFIIVPFFLFLSPVNSFAPNHYRQEHWSCLSYLLIHSNQEPKEDFFPCVFPSSSKRGNLRRQSSFLNYSSLYGTCDTALKRWGWGGKGVSHCPVAPVGEGMGILRIGICLSYASLVLPVFWALLFL